MFISKDKSDILEEQASNTTQMANAINLAVQRNAGNVYITNDVLPNPWDTLPTYWPQELNAIATKCSTS